MKAAAETRVFFFTSPKAQQSRGLDRRPSLSDRTFFRTLVSPAIGAVVITLFAIAQGTFYVNGFSNRDVDSNLYRYMSIDKATEAYSSALAPLVGKLPTHSMGRSSGKWVASLLTPFSKPRGILVTTLRPQGSDEFMHRPNKLVDRAKSHPLIEVDRRNHVLRREIIPACAQAD